MGLDLRKLGETMIERRLELGIVGLEVGEVSRKREVLLLEEGAGLLGGDGSGIGLSSEGLELLVEVAYESVGLVRKGRGVVSEPRELLVGDEERHRRRGLQFRALIANDEIVREMRERERRGI